MKTTVCPFVVPRHWQWPVDVEFPTLLELDKPDPTIHYEMPDDDNRPGVLRGFVVAANDYDPLIPHVKPPLHFIGERVCYDINQTKRTGRVRIEKRHVAARLDKVKIIFRNPEDSNLVTVTLNVFRIDPLELDL